jgi:methyl-accepting chemotaxis protein
LQASYNPIFDDSGKVVGVAKYATDITQQTNMLEKASADQARMLAESLRVKSALDGSTTGMMIADENLIVVYINDFLKGVLRKHEAAIAAQIPGFRVDNIMGRSIDVFHKVPSHQRGMLQNVHGHHRTRIPVGGRIMDIILGRAVGADGALLGYSMEWLDMTDEIAAQGEIEKVLSSSLKGDLTLRLNTEQYSGFLRQVGTGMNQLLDATSESFRKVKETLEQIGQAATQLRTTSQLMSTGAVTLNDPPCARPPRCRSPPTSCGPTLKTPPWPISSSPRRRRRPTPATPAWRT